MKRINAKIKSVILGKSSGVTTRQQAQKQMENSDADTVPDSVESGRSVPVNQKPNTGQEDATGKPKTEFQEFIEEIKDKVPIYTIFCDHEWVVYESSVLQ